MLNDILILDQQWLPNKSDFPPISWPWYRTWPSPIMSGFHGAFATGVACQQGTLTLPDTWFRPPFWDLLMLQLLRPNSSNLPCLYSTFHLEYPLVLSRFCCSWETVTPPPPPHHHHHHHHHQHHHHYHHHKPFFKSFLYSPMIRYGCTWVDKKVLKLPAYLSEYTTELFETYTEYWPTIS